MLLSMFFLYVSRSGRTLGALRTVTAMKIPFILCFAHGPPTTRLRRCDHNASHLARPRRDPPCVDRGPLVASPFFAE
jgi:hypothetical protein